MNKSVERRWPAIGTVIVVAGVILRAVQYLDQSSLWLDEAAMARNIVDRSFLELLRPLDYAQVAPLGFLWLERGAVVAFGASELSLRLLPFVSSVVALILFSVLAYRLLPAAAAALAAWLLATAVPMIFFAADVKPYSGDVLATVIVAVAATAPRARVSTLCWVIGMSSLGVLAWISNVLPLVLAGTGFGFAILALRRGSPGFREVALIGGLWVALAGPAVALAVRNVRAEDAVYLHRRWAEAFMPHGPRSAAAWAWHTVLAAIGHPGSWELNGALQYGAPLVIVPALALGCWWMWQHQREACLFLLLPVVAGLAASWAGLYPFAGRFVVFLLPSLLLMIAAGTVQAATLTRRRSVGLAMGVLVTFVAARALFRTLPPRRTEDLRPVLQTIDRLRQPGDAMYIYYGAGQAFLFYRGSTRAAPGAYVIGRCGRDHPEWLIQEVEGLRGAGRVWIVVSHTSNQMQELRPLVAHLASTGRQLEHIVMPGGGDAEAYLFALDAAPANLSREMGKFPAEAEASWECGGPVTAAPGRGLMGMRRSRNRCSRRSTLIGALPLHPRQSVFQTLKRLRLAREFAAAALVPAQSSKARDTIGLRVSLSHPQAQRSPRPSETAPRPNGIATIDTRVASPASLPALQSPVDLRTTSRHGARRPGS